ncbi:SDR family NAD(P)-dependent oxidoreductase [Chitiniphilus purpureus]|uniref:SDR family NAD(P)-dependent oxidoreductase n=1 Tax=Chitiniphilus purpureus TaxID=2981137 RepID=A0ABY6DI46_9NEIS|nr:SDR family NAD(P)-dependent oxidoreductase [Chitiniphilus sp. CD1]UXY14020.1 SDR family NAD(P)-dependent oxidoreductase [Chitiniphilus sp. CD1]
MTEPRTILITGCSSGIGLHAAHALKQRGWRVLASARAADDVARLEAAGFEALVLDVADSASIDAAVDWLAERTGGRLDALFNNAGFGVPGAVEDLTRQAMRHQFETNVFGAMELTNRVLPWMHAQRHGRLLFNSSVLGFAAMPARGAYNASKFALEGFCDTLRLELAGSGIHVVLIEPGPIESRFRLNAAREFEQWVAPHQTGRHAMLYERMHARLAKAGPSSRFTLGPEATSAAVIAALSSTRPAARYRVTTPTRVFWYLKRLLPTRWLDALLRMAGA